MKKRITTFIVLMFFVHCLFAQSIDSLTLNNFELEEIPVPERKSSYYNLTLLDSEDSITIRLYARPKEIAASYFDSNYLVLVYNSGSGHYLTGVYKEEQIWRQDYFHRALESSTGLSSMFLKEARFIDGETLLLTHEHHSSVINEKQLSYSILRICQNQIYKYKRPEKPFTRGAKGDTSIRPID